MSIAFDSNHRPTQTTNGGIDEVLDRIDDAAEAEAEAAEAKPHAKITAPSKKEWHRLALQLSSVTGRSLAITADHVAPKTHRQLAQRAFSRTVYGDTLNQIMIVVEITTRLPSRADPRMYTRWSASAYVPGLPSGKKGKKGKKVKDGIWRLEADHPIIRHVNGSNAWAAKESAEKSARDAGYRAIYGLLYSATAKRYASLKAENRIRKEHAVDMLQSEMVPVDVRPLPQLVIGVVRLRELDRYVSAFANDEPDALMFRRAIRTYRQSLGHVAFAEVAALDRHVHDVDSALATPVDRRVFRQVLSGAEPTDEAAKAAQKIFVELVIETLGPWSLPSLPRGLERIEPLIKPESEPELSI